MIETSGTSSLLSLDSRLDIDKTISIDNYCAGHNSLCMWACSTSGKRQKELKQE
jgi:hypothetical protein